MALLAVLVLGGRADALVGDCNGSGRVEISDLVVGTNVLLGHTPLSACSTDDTNGDGAVAVNELIVAVLYAMGALPAESPPTCGDGQRTLDEECDDGNRRDGDGCGSDCRLEDVGVLDQRWLGPVPPDCGFASGTTNLANGPLRQEFVPQRRALASVLVALAQAGSIPNGSLRVGIRRGTVDGPLLAWTLARVHTAPGDAPTWQRIQLPAPLAVEPDETYVLELTSTEDNLMLHSAGGTDGCIEAHYEPGDPIVDGMRYEIEDYLFATYGSDVRGVGAMEQSWQGPVGLCGTVARDVRLAGRVVAQTFTASGNAIGAIAVRLYADGPETGLARLTARLFDDAVEQPALASASLTLAAPIGTEAWYVFEFPSAVAIDPGRTYRLQLGDDADRFIWSGVNGDEACTDRDFSGRALVDGETIDTDFPFAVFAPVE